MIMSAVDMINRHPEGLDEYGVAPSSKAISAAAPATTTS